MRRAALAIGSHRDPPGHGSVGYLEGRGSDAAETLQIAGVGLFVDFDAVTCSHRDVPGVGDRKRPAAGGGGGPGRGGARRKRVAVDLVGPGLSLPVLVMAGWNFLATRAVAEPEAAPRSPWR